MQLATSLRLNLLRAPGMKRLCRLALTVIVLHHLFIPEKHIQNKVKLYDKHLIGDRPDRLKDIKLLCAVFSVISLDIRRMWVVHQTL